MKKLMMTLVSLAGALTFACAGSQAESEVPDAEVVESSEAAPPEGTPVSSTATPTTFAEQVSMGQELYTANCASCHGASGEGGKAPPVVGLNSGALPLEPPEGAKYRTSEFQTVADIAEFVVANMPPGKGGSLTNEEYWAILAFDLKANGIELDQKLTPELASTLEVPRQ